MRAKTRVKSVISSLITLNRLGERPRARRVAYNAKISGRVVVGDYTYIGGRTEIRAVLCPIEIGRYCSIGRDVKIFSAGQAHRFDGLSTFPFFVLDATLDRNNFNVVRRPTVIGNDVWIGSNAVVQSGVHIGDGAVVGSSAVVTRDIAPYAIVAGAPARVIGERFNAELAAKVAATRWWDLSYAVLKQTYPEFVIDNRPLGSWMENGLSR